MITVQQAKQLEVLLGEINSKLHHIAFLKTKMLPYAEVIIGPTSGIIPDEVKAFNVINLGLNGTMASLQDIPIVGVIGLTAIPRTIQTFCFSIENDQNVIGGPVTITPVASHHVLIQYLK